MKLKLLSANFMAFLTEAASHAAHENGHPEQTSNALLPSVSPILVASIGMTLLGTVALVVSYRKYKKTS